MYSDKEVHKKSGIFDRLELKSEVNEPSVKASTSSSIFSRLGGKSESDIDLDESVSVSFAGILKSAPKKVSTENLISFTIGSKMTY